MEVIMKNAKNLSKILYVFVILSLVYTGYTLFSTYSAISSYVSAGSITTGQVVETLISYCFTPAILTVILYALANMNEILIQFLDKQEKSIEDNQNDLEPEEDIKEETIESEEIIDKTKEDQA